ncbi:Sulfatase [Clostridium cavendishii DSM 21758]|uniref:Sulfatase n=1 Tax=Clostridium cavendishii DSM 21758 TaxID=1121302 RepID=A0A1M6AZF5_9CLOT|nr:sulfatase-like hydrolase/transferase [Clostridium cavendishii]SHI41842.1 Sulfatase [Clostridium cavendishii DSM 21758]
MNIYDFKVDKIISTFFKEDYNFDSEYSYIYITIRNYLQEVYKNGIVAIWGLGKHTDVLLTEFNEYISKTNFYIERNCKQLNIEFYNNKKVISPNDLINNNVDKIIISSFAYREEIKEQIDEFNKVNKLKIEIIDIYSYLLEQNIELNDVFYLAKHDYGGYREYKKINDIYLKYKISKNVEEKERYLKILIYKYICIRDFIYALNFIDEYIKCNYKDIENMKLLKSEINNLLKELKETVKSNNKDNIFILLLDALKARNVYKDGYMKFLESFAKKNTYFTNAYSTSIYTEESLISSLIGQLPFENCNYLKKSIKREECAFIEEGENKGYNFKAYILDDWLLFEDYKENCFDGGKYISKTMWDAIVNIDSNNNNMTFIYELSESHAPFISGFHSKEVMNFGKIINLEEIDYEQNVKYQMIESLEYLDKQLEFYLSFLKDDDSVIIFSDHGNMGESYSLKLTEAYEKLGWAEDRIRIPIIVKNKEFGKQKINSLISLMDINELIIKVINKNNEIPKRRYCRVQFSPINNIMWQKALKEAQMDEFLYGFEIFIKDKLKYVKTGTGEKMLYKINNYEDIFIQDFSILQQTEKEFKDNIMIGKMRF